MKAAANFVLLPGSASELGLPSGSLVIRDLGPWDKYKTVTNVAAEVVRELTDNGTLTPGRRLFYFDSEGELDELRHDGSGRFLGFAPGPRAELDAVKANEETPASEVANVLQMLRALRESAENAFGTSRAFESMARDLDRIDVRLQSALRMLREKGKGQQ